MSEFASRGTRLDQVLTDLMAQATEIEAASVVSFDGLPMASALPAAMDEDRVAAMSAALLSLGERAAEGLGRGELSQLYIEGEHGTVFLVSADGEAVLVAVAAQGAKAGLMLYEVRRAASAVADALRAESQPVPAAQALPAQPAYDSYVPAPTEAPVQPAAYAPEASGGPSWPSYTPNGSASSAEHTSWS